MSCYTCDKKHPYRAEVVVSIKDKVTVGEVASRTEEGIVKQAKHLAEFLVKGNASVDITYFFNEKELNVIEKTA